MVNSNLNNFKINVKPLTIKKYTPNIKTNKVEYKVDTDKYNSSNSYEDLDYSQSDIGENSSEKKYISENLLKFFVNLLYTPLYGKIVSDFLINIANGAGQLFNLKNITSSEKFDMIVETMDRYRYCIRDGKVVLIKDNKDNVFKLNEDGTITCTAYLKESLDIFNDLNNHFEQYGGNQMSFRYNNSELIAREDINKIIESYYPNATNEQRSLLLHRICSVGCGYTSLGNAIFKKYNGNEREFKEKFGFDMFKLDSNGHVVYNYEPLILEIILEYYKNEGNYTIEELYGNQHSSELMIELSDLFDVESTGKITGTWVDKYKQVIEQLNKKYNLDLSFNGYTCSCSMLNKNNIQSFFDQGYTIIIGSSGYDLYDYETGKLHTEDGGGHAMTIVGFADDGRAIVSSWGKKYIIDLSNVDPETGDFSFIFVK